MQSKRLLPARTLAIAPLAAVAALALFASTAMAKKVMIVTQGEFPPVHSNKVLYFHTIQAAVDATAHGDYVLVEPGVYDEAVKVQKPHSHIWIRGMNRNTVILDGQHKGGNGIEIYKDNDVWVENLTVRNFELTESCGDEECGNEIWWNGGSGSGKIGAHGWFWSSYLTAYDTGRHERRLRDLHQRRDRRLVGRHLLLGHGRLGHIPRCLPRMQGSYQQSRDGR